MKPPRSDWKAVVSTYRHTPNTLRCNIGAIVEGPSTLKRYSGQEHPKSRPIAYVVLLAQDARLCVAFDLLCMEQGRGIGGTAQI